MFLWVDMHMRNWHLYAFLATIFNNLFHLDAYKMHFSRIFGRRVGNYGKSTHIHIHPTASFKSQCRNSIFLPSFIAHPLLFIQFIFFFLLSSIFIRVKRKHSLTTLPRSNRIVIRNINMSPVNTMESNID